MFLGKPEAVRHTQHLRRPFLERIMAMDKIISLDHLLHEPLVTWQMGADIICLSVDSCLTSDYWQVMKQQHFSD